MTSGIPGSSWTPRPDTADRLRIWRRHATVGTPVDDIAARLGMAHDALDQMVLRARRHGHPDAIHHANGRPPRRSRTPGGTP